MNVGGHDYCKEKRRRMHCKAVLIGDISVLDFLVNWIVFRFLEISQHLRSIERYRLMRIRKLSFLEQLVV